MTQSRLTQTKNHDNSKFEKKGKKKLMLSMSTTDTGTHGFS